MWLKNKNKMYMKIKLLKEKNKMLIIIIKKPITKNIIFHNYSKSKGK